MDAANYRLPPIYRKLPSNNINSVHSPFTIPVTFRPATPADAPAIADLYLASRKTFLPYAPIAHPDDTVYPWVWDAMLPHTRITVAERDGEVVGFMALMEQVDSETGERTGWLDQLYLLPSAVGQGLGSALVARAKTELGSPIRLYTFQENHGARRFYERHGFQAIRFGDGSSNEEGCPDVLYEWWDASVAK